MHKLLIFFLIIAVVIFLLCLAYLVLAAMVPSKDVTWGVNFSQMQANTLKLNWKETYLAILEDLNVKQLKLITNWDYVEGRLDDFYFNDVDWQVKQAEVRNVNLIYVVGMKTGRWPECHVPTWANNLSKADQQDKILAYVAEVVNRYKSSKAIVSWQAENEPLFNFGKCPWYDTDFLKKEVALIKSLDPSRSVIVSDTGDQSTWFTAAKIGDELGITLYRKVWLHITNKFGFYVTYLYPPKFYGIKAALINVLFHKKVIVVEFQAEPWVPKNFLDVPLEEQEKSMNLLQLKENIAFAQKTGLDEFYLWGAEWWYWLKTVQNKPEIWDYARGVFKK